MLPFLLAGNQCMFYREVLVSLWQIIIRFPPSKNVKKKKILLVVLLPTFFYLFEIVVFDSLSKYIWKV